MTTRVDAGTTGMDAERAQADLLAGRICAAAAASAQTECQLLELVGEFDAAGAVRWWDGVKSMAHWLSWACSMSAGTAREHVRVARALRRMPTVREAFGAGRLSYSKVREVTRVVDVIDEAMLCSLALTATASQLGRMLAAFRAADGTRVEQQLKRSGRWICRDDGMVDFRFRLPTDEAAVVIAAIEAAQDRFGEPPVAPDRTQTAADQVDTTPRCDAADALLGLARTFLAESPEDRSGEDRGLVVVHVAAEQLAAKPDDPADADDPADPDDPDDPDENVPAGTSTGGHRQVCHIAGVGPVEPATATRLACDADLLGAVVDRHGEVLALGRTRRLVSRAQRRALLIRDGMCRFPGCHQTRHLKAHHVIHWSAGGPTDLDNLVLLCQWHHTAVHEGGLRLTRTPGEGSGWVASYPDGSPLRPRHSASSYALVDALSRRRAQLTARLSQVVSGFDGPESRTIRPGWAGERFELRSCVAALFGMRSAA